jgi:hypothetical protein
MGRARTAAKRCAWLLGGCVLVLAAWLGINATDEPLSDEARAALVVPPLPAPDPDNGFLDYLVIGAPADVPTFEAGLERLKALNNQSNGTTAPPPWGDYQRDPRVPRCVFGAAAGEKSERPACLEAALDPRLPEILRQHATYLGRYRAMRGKARFVSLFEPKSAEDALPSFLEVTEGHRLILLGAGRRFHAGDRAGAVRELEQEAAFYRRMSKDAVSLIDKMIAFAMLDRIALFSAELARRMPRGEAASWKRLEALLGPLTKEELDVLPSLRRELAQTVRLMQDRRFVRPSERVWEGLAYIGKTKPWWDPVAPYLYRPHQTANWYAACGRILLSVGERPSTEFFTALAAAKEQSRSLDPGPLASVIINPAGWRNPYGTQGCDTTDYIARAHGRAGVQTLSRLVVKLRAAGISKPEDVAAALAGPLGAAHPDPFTGKPMRFDPSGGTVGFDILTAHLSGVARELGERYGKLALRL